MTATDPFLEERSRDLQLNITPSTQDKKYFQTTVSSMNASYCANWLADPQYMPTYCTLFTTIGSYALLFFGGIPLIDMPRRDAFKRKYFPTEESNIRGANMMVTRGSDGSQKAIRYEPDIQTPKNDIVIEESVAYYFDFLVDGQISHDKACKAASQFNRNSYYIDLDFECENIKETNPLHIDIYGKVTEPEICL